MLRKTDKIYAFSLSRDGSGRIIASGKHETDNAEGCDVFVHLGISSAEKEFFKENIEDSDAVALLRAKNTRRRTVVFFRLFPRQAFFVAVEFGSPAEVVLAVLLRCFDRVSASPGCEQWAKRHSARVENWEDEERYVESVCTVFSEIASLSSSFEPCELHLLERLLAREAEMLGLPICYLEQKDMPSWRKGEDRIFDGASLFALITVIMLAVARYEDGDTLSLTMREFDNLPILEASFPQKSDEAWLWSLKRLYEVVENSHNHIFHCAYQSGRVRICFCPFYEESALFSVKARDAMGLFFCDEAEDAPAEIVFLGAESE